MRRGVADPGGSHKGNPELEHAARRSYHGRMDDTPNPVSAPAGWLEALDRAEEDVAAARTVAGDAVLRSLHETLAKMEARETAASRKAARRR